MCKALFSILLERFITTPRRVALVIVDELAIRAEALLRFVTPEKTVARVRNGLVPFRIDVQAFPAKVVAAVVVDPSQRGSFARHTP
jgi:hypothetical protein